jgi:dTDP-4-amino-4,6-dideoxy-D-galactose acyltransferase
MKTIMNSFQILDWDSEFFEIIIARVLPQRLTTVQLEQIIAGMKEKKVRLAYWSSNPNDKKSQLAALACQGYLADRKVMFVADIEQVQEPAGRLRWVIEEYTDTYTNNELENLAIQAGAYSRFKLDPRIPERKFEDLYKLWIRKSVNREIADTVLVARHAGNVVGMVTVGEKNGRSDIGLISVDTCMRGKSIGRSLVSAAQKWGRKKGYNFTQVVTQEENIVACKLYERCGYRIDKTKYLYHFWI